ncbi:hypothetical protein HanIR_Chr13g0636271 [Helianthus annuus]|nr:hypothetical protein HanIR_Chr13g0636271 [Helianthus annuus]
MYRARAKITRLTGHCMVWYMHVFDTGKERVGLRSCRCMQLLMLYAHVAYD